MVSGSSLIAYFEKGLLSVKQFLLCFALPCFCVMVCGLFTVAPAGVCGLSCGMLAGVSSGDCLRHCCSSSSR